MNGTQTDQIRQIITSVFSSRGIDRPITVAVLLRNNRFLGWKYTSGGVRAIWLPEKGVVKVLDQDGKVIEAIPVEQGEEQPAKVA